MEEKNGKIICDARLVVDKFDPLEIIDLYVTEEEWKRLLEVFGGRNRVMVALRMKGIG